MYGGNERNACYCGGCLCDCTLAQTRLVQYFFTVTSPISKQMQDNDAANGRTDSCNSLLDVVSLMEVPYKRRWQSRVQERCISCGASCLACTSERTDKMRRVGEEVDTSTEEAPSRSSFRFSSCGLSSKELPAYYKKRKGWKESEVLRLKCKLLLHKPRSQQVWK